VAQTFISGHPNAVGLDLGAGLDTRIVHIAPTSTVDWYHVDFPEVITARRQLLPDRLHAHGIGTDLTDPAWLEEVPTNRPAVIVADGLIAFLSQEDMILLLNRLIDHFQAANWHSTATPSQFGREALSRNPVRRGTDQISRLRRRSRTGTLEPPVEADQGSPADPGTGGRSIPARPSAAHPASRAGHSLVS
jgi:O-methyltransferase involved in polyketide biosynthesis